MLVYSSFPLVGGLRPDCSHGISSTLYITAVLSLASINLLLKHLIKAGRKRTTWKAKVVLPHISFEKECKIL